MDYLVPTPESDNRLFLRFAPLPAVARTIKLWFTVALTRLHLGDPDILDESDGTMSMHAECILHGECEVNYKSLREIDGF
jgi:hypothetical protein